MARVMAEMTMSLDGFVADPEDGVDELFGWYDNGEVEVALPGAGGPDTFRTTEASAGLLREMLGGIGAVVSGRRMFDITDGWGGSHPLGVPVVVVTHAVPEAWVAGHPDADVTFVTEGVAAAVSRAREAAEAAGRELVGVGGADVARQCLDLGLLDEIRVNLAPVLLGAGVPFFAHLAHAPVRLGDPRVVEGRGVTHLYYPVGRP